MSSRLVVQAKSTTKERMKFAGILVFLSIAATLMGTLNGFNGQEWIRWFLGGFLIMFGGFKMIGIEVFLRVFPLYDLIAKRFALYKYAYPLLQAFIGMWYITGLSPLLRDIIVLVISFSGLWGMLKLVSARGAVRLAYLGNIIQLRYSTVTIIENATIVTLAIVMLATDIAL